MDHQTLSTSSPAPPAPPIGSRLLASAQRFLKTFPVISALIFAALTFGMFARLLFNAKDDIWSRTGNDMTSQFLPWWKFAFGEIANGNFPLWNPHNFCGTPFFSNFNPGMLFPPHWLVLVLPLWIAINLILVVDVFLAGWFTSLWIHGRGNSPLASILGGVIYMFSGAYFHHIFPGHAAPLASMAFAPLIFLCIDGIFRDRSWTWALLGMFAVAMQIFGGFPQAVYYTGLMGGLYVLLRLFKEPQWRRVVLLFTMVYVGGVALAAVQILPGLGTAHESVRQGGNSFDFAAVGALRPETFGEFLAPAFLGDFDNSKYIGTSFPWEISLFVGLSTLILAGYGAAQGDPRLRRFSGVLFLVASVVALGVNLKPVFCFMYYCVPMFSNFRVAARFNWFMTLHLAMLASIGFDVLVNQRVWRPKPVLITVAAALAVGALALLCYHSSQSGPYGGWGRMVQSLGSSKDRMVAMPELDDALVATTGKFAAMQLAHSAIWLLAFALLLFLLKYSVDVKYLLAAFTLAEVAVFANSVLATGPMYLPYPSNWTAATESISHESRVMHPTLEFPNTAMIYNFNDVYGYDPVTLKRFSDFIAATQDMNPDQTNFVTQIMRLKYPKLFQLLRCEYVFFTRDGLDENKHPVRVPEVLRLDSPFPHVMLFGQYAVGNSRDEILAGLRDPKFDPRQTVLLESPPDPEPSPASQGKTLGSAWVSRSSTDWLEIKADLPAPAILLVTDAYSKYWHAEAIDPGPQPEYNVIPADYTLRAIPLAAGHHHILLVYSPIGYTIGKWVTIVSLLAWLFLMISFLVRRVRHPASSDEAQIPTAVVAAV